MTLEEKINEVANSFSKKEDSDVAYCAATAISKWLTDKVCQHYEDELRQINNLFTIANRDLKDLIDIDKSVKSFRKTIEL